MLKLPDIMQIRAADQYTIEHEPISSVDLMERAALAFVQRFTADADDKSVPVYVFCGSGNNGGDGLAIARLLAERRYDISVYLFESKKQSADYTVNLKRLQKKYRHCIHYISDTDCIETLRQNAVVIDAIFGSGLNQPILSDSIYGQVIEKLNSKKFTQVIAADIPSGLFADRHTDGVVVRCTHCYTFQFPKLAFMVPENGTYIPDFTVLDIGLHPDFCRLLKTTSHCIEIEDIKTILHSRTKFSHKGSYGHALLIAGSYGKMGAAVLAAQSCLRAGAGLLTVHIPKCGYSILQTAFPEAMCQTDKNINSISTVPLTKKYDAVAIGPGISEASATQKAFISFLKKNTAPLIIDADGLNILSKNKPLLKDLPENCILTPHPKEFERLAGKWKNDFERLELQRNFSKKYKVIVILKGAHTSISDTKGDVWFNTTGNPGMATAGSGDVLTGILTGLLSQHYTPLESALAGVYLHGLSGDLALQLQSLESLIASDITAHLGEAFTAIHTYE
jgi:ADP-dependent NAD(P)H-hydrate dehydratase / NAD(P)H-hydrate epimerase